MKLMPWIVMISILLQACTISPQATPNDSQVNRTQVIERATQTPLPTDTSTIPLTRTDTPTITSTSTNTLTPTETPVPTPSTVRVEGAVTDMDTIQKNIELINEAGGLFFIDSTSGECNTVEIDTNRLQFVQSNPADPEEFSIYYDGKFYGKYVRWAGSAEYKLLQIVENSKTNIPIRLVFEMKKFTPLRKGERTQFTGMFRESFEDSICGGDEGYWSVPGWDQDSDIQKVNNLLAPYDDPASAIEKYMQFWAAVSNELHTTRMGSRKGSAEDGLSAKNGFYGLDSAYVDKVIKMFNSGLPQEVKVTDLNHQNAVWKTEKGVYIEWLDFKQMEPPGVLVDQDGALHIRYSSVVSPSGFFTGDQNYQYMFRFLTGSSLTADLGFQPNYRSQANLLAWVAWTLSQHNTTSVFNVVKIR